MAIASAIPEEDYKKSVEKLKSEWEKDKEGALALMAITYDRRRKWITQEADSVHTILKEFPCLKSYDFVSCCCTYALMHRYTICSSFCTIQLYIRSCFGSLKKCMVTKSVK